MNHNSSPRLKCMSSDSSEALETYPLKFMYALGATAYACSDLDPECTCADEGSIRLSRKLPPRRRMSCRSATYCATVGAKGDWSVIDVNPRAGVTISRIVLAFSKLSAIE